MNELILIKYFILNIDIYNKYYKYINKEYILSIYKEYVRIYNSLELWYSTNQKAFGSIDDYIVFFFSQYPALKKGDVEYYNIVFDRIKGLHIADGVAEAALEAHRKHAVASKLAGIAWEVSEGKRSFEELPTAFAECTKDLIIPAEDDGLDFVPMDVRGLLSHTYGRGGLKWRLVTLRKMMGSLRKGDFGFIFSRPEVGKTTLICSQGVYFAQQLDKPYLHFNNEEQSEKVAIRYIQAATGLTTREIDANPEAAQKAFEEYTKGNIRLVNRNVVTKRDVEAYCKKYEPGAILIDSIDKVTGFPEDRDDLMYKAIYQWSRELAKQYGPVIGVCHAAVSGEGKKYLEMGDVAYAKTAKQGEADWILGLGSSLDRGSEYVRYLHLPKNKLMGDEEMEEELRHGKLSVLIHPDIAQYSDISYKEE